MTIQQHRWLAGVELLLVFVTGFLFWLAPQGFGFWAVLPLAAAALLRTGRRGWSGRRSPLDWPVALFVLTALPAAAIAYDPQGAWQKAAMIAIAACLYLAVSRQEALDGWDLAGLSGGWAAGISLYFLLTHDWTLWPADLAIIDRLGRRWMGLRPPFDWPAWHPNIGGGILAMLLPLLLAWIVHAHRAGERRRAGLGVALASVAAVGLLATSSRAAWLALAVALGLWLFWRLCRLAAGRFALSPRALFAGSLVGLGLLAWMISPIGLLDLVRAFPGPDQSTSRLVLIDQTLDLWRDFLLTGGGLASFGGLYSQYILVIPHFRFDYAHNFFLDVALEQGLPGLLALIGLIAAGGWILVRAGGEGRRWGSGMAREALLTAGVVVLLHGLVDDPLYGRGGSPLLFWLPALISLPPAAGRPAGQRGWLLLGGMAAILVIGGLLLVGGGLPGRWQANLGALEMARIELAGWPTNRWDTGENSDAFGPAAARFERALDRDPANLTAHYRLGLIAMLRRDYAAAAGHLEAAHAIDPGHRGVVKNLGYALVWLGETERAAGLLVMVPEAAPEMDAYQFWWSEQGRPDLAERAAAMVLKLNS